MSNESLILLENVSIENWDGVSESLFLFGQKQKGSGYHKNSSNLHTVVFQFDNFLGEVKLQGTLELYPSDSDWVDIDYSSGLAISAIDSTVLSANETRNFEGNFVWIRAGYRLIQGSITEIRFNF